MILTHASVLWNSELRIKTVPGSTDARMRELICKLDDAGCGTQQLLFFKHFFIFFHPPRINTKTILQF